MAQTLTRTKAALYLKVSERTLGRLVSAGKLRRNPDKSFDVEELERFTDEEDASEFEEREDEGERQNLTLGEMRQGYNAATNHAERLIALLERPINQALTTLTAINASLLEDRQRSGELQLRMMSELGELLMMKTEREARAAEAVAKTQAIAGAGKQVAKFLPRMFEQMAGKNMLSSFIEKLTPEEKSGLWELVPAFFEDEKPTDKSKAFEQLLLGAGIEKPITTKGEEVTNV